MRRRLRLPAGLLALSLAAGCAHAPPPVPEADVARAREALAPLKQKLLGALTQAMAEGGPERAIDVCRVEAPAIARAVATEGVELGRTSHRLRNPANAPRPWVEPLLAEYVADPAGAAPRGVRLAGGGIGYVEPIRTMRMCLKCHGEDVAEAILERVRLQYPGDRAVGFREGDLRGLFWVEIAPSS